MKNTYQNHSLSVCSDRHKGIKQWMLYFIIGMLLLAGCGKKDVQDEEAYHIEKEKIKIGMIFDTFVVERWQRDRDKFVSAANELGAEVDVQNANGDAGEQAKQIRYFIEKQVDVIVIVPIESQVLIEPIKDARKAGIKIISYDRLVNDANTDLYISFDNEEIGNLMGEAIGGELSSGDKVLMVAGPVSDNNVDFVNTGFQNEMEKFDIEILDISYTEGWKAEYAAAYIEENLDKVMQVQAIMCGNDNLAGQVIRVLSESRLAGNILVTGQDSDLEACQRIVEGTQLMTVYKPVELLAERAAQAAVEIAQTGKIETNDTITDGTYEVPYIKLNPLPVTSENIKETIIDTGFHLKEDVYINRPNMLE